jgi:site-specific DNA recombinase
MKTAVLYARFSSDLQKDRSIDDQLAICRDLAKREEIKVGPSFADRAKSGASLFERDGLLELMAAAKRREAARAFHAEWAAREKKTRGDAAQTRKQLNRIQMQIDRLVVAIRDSDVPVHDLLPQLKPLDAERAGLMERLRLIEANNNVVHLHPNVIEAYSLNVEKLHAALTLDSMSAENRTAFRNVIDTIVVHPTGKRMAYEFTPYGRLSAIMGVDLFPTARHTLEAETYSKPGRSGKSVSS